MPEDLTIQFNKNKLPVVGYNSFVHITKKVNVNDTENLAVDANIICTIDCQQLLSTQSKGV